MNEMQLLTDLDQRSRYHGYSELNSQQRPVMQSNNLEWNFTVFRATTDRRVQKPAQPPFLSAEGFSLVDRRQNPDRRAPESGPSTWEKSDPAIVVEEVCDI
jgi:hypothetical protein